MSLNDLPTLASAGDGAGGDDGQPRELPSACVHWSDDAKWLYLLWKRFTTEANLAKLSVELLRVRSRLGPAVASFAFDPSCFVLDADFRMSTVQAMLTTSNATLSAWLLARGAPRRINVVVSRVMCRLLPSHRRPRS